MNQHKETKVDRCKRWMLNLLKQGPKKPSDVISLAKEFMGFSRATVFRARAELGDQIENTEGRRDPNNRWKLAVKG